jgi:SGF29 tudor-like domain
MSRMNNNMGEGDLPQQQSGYPQKMMGRQGFPQGMPMLPSPQNPSGHSQHLQHHERLLQLKMQQQQLEMQLKQNNMSISQMHAAPMMQQQKQQQLQHQTQNQQQPHQQQHMQLQRRRSEESLSSASIAPKSSPLTLAKPPDLTRVLSLPPASPQSTVVNAETDAPSTATNLAQPSIVKREPSTQMSTPIVPTKQMQQLISTLNWTDRTIYASRLVMGGAGVNGFLRATATAQRIKKQRARQIKKQQVSPNEEEILKKEAMNPRTAKKLRTELVAGLEFCKSLHEILKTVVKELDPSQVLASLAEPDPVAIGAQSATYIAPSAPKPIMPAPVAVPTTKRAMVPPPAPSTQANTATSTTTASPGDPNGSTLRKLRKRKFPEVPTPDIGEIILATGKKYSKKDYALILLEIGRFRTLKEGDYVAAKLSSRDLWILARVVKDYLTDCGPAAEFLMLSEAKRDALFAEKVMLKDVEDSQSSTIAVSRSNVLPLPRTFAEAADWGSRCRKGSRVYAMYPMTTSLYSGTVIDNTTYCRGDDDIIVVEFDGDEADAKTGKMPQYHIPGRFVTLIPREFPGAVQNQKKRKASAPPMALPMSGGIKGAKRSGIVKHKRGPSSDSAFNDMLEEIPYGDIGGDLDLDQFELEFDDKK